MADVHDVKTRSYNMSQIRGKDTKPEILVRKLLFNHGFRYKLHDKTLPGKPDLVLPKYKTVLLINGCFWHGHEGCQYFVIPKTRTEWWRQKINNTKIKDDQNIKNLKNLGWKVKAVWECELKPNKREATLSSLLKEIKEDE
ncbi:MAG: DNA mismatch endonuclease Vsr [Bacteroidota bacterium]